MKKVLLISVLSLFAFAVNATPIAAEMLQVNNAYARETAPNQNAGAVFLELKNTGKTSQELVAAYSPVAKQVQLHKTVKEHGQMKMVQQFGIKIHGDDTFTFSPGHYHIMLIGLKAPLTAGETVTLTLLFRDGSYLVVSAPVKNVVK